MGSLLNKLEGKDPTTSAKAEHEANKCPSRMLWTYFGDQKVNRLVYEHETANEFLESHYRAQLGNHEIELHCQLNKQIVLESTDEISLYWDEVESIHIVPAGTGVSKDYETSELDEPIKKKP